MEGEGHPTGEHVNISEYVNILIEPQDQEVCRDNLRFRAQNCLNETAFLIFSLSESR
jgi:hypothetical protein